MLRMSNPAEPRGERVALEEIQPRDLLQALDLTRGALLATAPLLLCLGPFSRARGLLGRPPLASDQGLLLRPCSGVHTFFMGYAIDVAFLDRAGRVVGLRPQLRPWRATPLLGEAHATLELAAGRLAACAVALGDQVVFERE